MTERTCTMPDCGKRHYAKDLCKTHYNRNLRTDTVMATCSVCDATFTARAGNRQVYCSAECRRQGWRDSGRSRPIPGRVRRDGHMVYPFCTVHFTTCTQCRSLFTSRSASARWCSDRCRYLGTAAMATCRDCGGPREKWMARCTQCRRKSLMRARRIARAQRRARVRQTQVEPIDPREIHERDGWRCGICRRRVDQQLQYPHPRSASLDHIVPLARGGGHVKTNVQCSHLKCNLDKRDAEAGQELLFG